MHDTYTDIQFLEWAFYVFTALGLFTAVAVVAHQELIKPRRARRLKAKH